MFPTLPWPALASLVAGCGALYTVRTAWSHRDQPGGRYWIGFIVAIGVWSLTYGVGLLVFDPVLRRAVGVPIWLSKSLVPPLFLGFALAYTGRTHLATSRWATANLALWVGIGLTEGLNPFHHLLWQNYRLDPVFASATVSMEIQPLLYATYLLSYLELTVALVLLLEALLRYGSVYRRQIIALIVGAALPTATTAVWVFRLSPVPQLNLTPVAIAATVATGYYALFRGELFEVSPSTQRAADRAALDDLGSAVVVVTPENRIVDLNATAERVFSTDRSVALGRPVSRLVSLGSGNFAPTDGDQETTVSVRVDGERRVFKLSQSVLTDATERTVGSTLVFQDVTVERQREQRLQVLNRVLRHNLRNDMNVVNGYLGAAERRVEDDRASEMIQTARSEAKGLLAVSEKARALEQLMDRDERSTETITVTDVLQRIRDEQVSSESDTTLTIDVPAGLTLEANAELLSVLFGNLVENALEHGGSDPNPRVELLDVTDDDVAVFAVRDDGPGIPAHERAAVERGQEDPLEHGSSLGLWLVEWCATTLGGEVGFEDDDTGTTVRVEVPGVIDAATVETDGVPAGGAGGAGGGTGDGTNDDDSAGAKAGDESTAEELASDWTGGVAAAKRWAESIGGGDESADDAAADDAAADDAAADDADGDDAEKDGEEQRRESATVGS